MAKTAREQLERQMDHDRAELERQASHEWHAGTDIEGADEERA